MRNLPQHLLVVILLLVITLTGCGGGSSFTADNVVMAFQNAGLEAENARPLTKDDYGLAPYIGSGVRFFIPALCDDCGGRIFITDNQEDTDTLKTYYQTLGEQSALFFSWVFVRDNIVVQINGDVPEEQAREYEATLMAME